MSREDEKDRAGRKQPSKYRRRKRAINAAKQRWKDKRRLIPGLPLPWSERSLANKQRHLAAARKGGLATGHQIREQQRLYWNWFHGGDKTQLRGSFKAVIETLERIEKSFNQHYRGTRDGVEFIAWDGFLAEMFETYVLVACGRKNPADIEKKMWARFHEFMEADETALFTQGFLNALHRYEDKKKEKKYRIETWRAKHPGHKQNI
jgi:hypothetical protein